MGAFSIWHIVVIAIVAAFLFFGWKQLPDMARSFARSLRVFKTEIKGMTDDDNARDSAREKAREDTSDDVSMTKQVEAAPQQPVSQPVSQPAPRVTPRAEVVPNRGAAASSGTRPRPAPNPNGRAHS